MTWYNPRTWFGPSAEELSPITLYCANPQCENPVIHDSRIAYSEEEREIYHPGECQLYALAHKCWQAPSIMMGNFEMIDRNKALRLAHRGQIKTTQGLEA
ncbi:MAG: hypothetical protein AABX72_03245, partial [Nanoarchaeota archaeon]